MHIWDCINYLKKENWFFIFHTWKFHTSCFAIHYRLEMQKTDYLIKNFIADVKFGKRENKRKRYVTYITTCLLYSYPPFFGAFTYITILFYTIRHEISFIHIKIRTFYASLFIKRCKVVELIDRLFSPQVIKYRYTWLSLSYTKL